MMTLTLPYPPSVNKLYATVDGRRVLSYQGRLYHRDVALTVSRQLADRPKFGSGRLAYTATVFPPDRRRRDISNIVKCLEDALTKAGVWGDDSQVDRLTIIRGHQAPGGSVFIEIGEILEELA